MLIQRAPDIRSSEITPKPLYLNRRAFLAGLPLAGAALTTSRARAAEKLSGITKSPLSTTEKVTPYQDVTHYNNYYEFSTDKYDPAELAKSFSARPWTVKVDGLDDLLDGKSRAGGVGEDPRGKRTQAPLVLDGRPRLIG